MLLSYFLCLLLPSLWARRSFASGLVLERDTGVAAPNCSLSCLSDLIPRYCDSTSNTTCICSNTNLTSAISSCAYQVCSTIPELLQLQKSSAVLCGVANDKARLNAVLMMDYVVPFVTALFVGGRIVARVRLDVELGADDWTILAAAAFYFVDVGTSLGLVLNGFGQHTYWLTTEEIITGRKSFIAVELFYLVSITLTKLALLLFFLRIFPDQRLRQAIWITGLFFFVSNFSLLMAIALQCLPIHGLWTNWMYKVAPVKCINTYATLEAAAVFSILQSVIILIIPIPIVWKLKLAWKKKANLMIMFSVGSIALTCSFMRLPSLIRLHHSNDLSYDQAPVVLYSHLEQSVGIICACLPACRSLLEYFFPSLKMTFEETSVTDARAFTDRTPTALPRSRVVKNSSTRSLVELDERSVRSERGIERLSTRTLSSDDDLRTKSSHDDDLGVHTTVETGAIHSTGNGTNHGIYITKSAGIVKDSIN